MKKQATPRAKVSLGERLLRLGAYLTVEQWRAIDRDYQRHSGFDGKALLVFITAAVVLICSKYLGKSDFILGIPAAANFFKTLPYPLLWPKLYWACCSVVNYFLLPALVIKLVFRERIRDFGWHFEKNRRVLLLYAAMFCIVLPLVVLVSFTPSFANKYPFYHLAARSLPELLLWEGAYGSQFVMLEFFFRGFLLFALARYLGSHAIFVMVLPYTMIHFTKPAPETMGAVITGIALGTLALRTRSILGGILIHTAVAWSMDLAALAQKGQLQRLFGSLLA